MTNSEKSYRNLLREVRLTPPAMGFDYIHRHLRGLVNSNFFDPANPWIETDQFMAVAKFLFLFGPRRMKKRKLTISNLFNRYKDFWTAAEAENAYADDPQLLGLFVLRFVYQQSPFHVFPNRIPRMFQRTRDLYLASDNKPTGKLNPAGEFERLSGVPLDVFLKTAEALYAPFVRSVRLDKPALASYVQSSDLRFLDAFLNVVAADRHRFSDLYTTNQADTLAEKPYEFNPFLRYPVAYVDELFWAPFPELIPYAATRGLFFYLSDKFEKAVQ